MLNLTTTVILSYVYYGQDDRALEDFNKAIALDQNIAVTYRNRGNLYLRMGNKELPSRISKSVMMGTKKDVTR
jgi:tetratricopeptide (TPR) repeat protein